MNAWREGGSAYGWTTLDGSIHSSLNRSHHKINFESMCTRMEDERRGGPRPLAKDNEDVRSARRLATIARVAEPKKNPPSSLECLRASRSSFFSSSSPLTAKFRPPTLLPPPPPRSSRPFLFYSPYLVTEFGRRRRRPMPLGLRPSLFPLSAEEEAAHKSPHSAF